jgi:hypothetical protein
MIFSNLFNKFTFKSIVMTTQSHTIILTTPRLEIPENPNVIQLVNDMIHNNLCNIDYFGSELDNHQDYIDDEMASKLEATSFIKLHFDNSHYEILDYDFTDENACNLFLEILMENEIKQVIVDDKDIEIYIH